MAYHPYTPFHNNSGVTFFGANPSEPTYVSSSDFVYNSGTSSLSVPNLIIASNGYIGSAGDPDAISIAANGNTVFSQNVSVNGNFTVNGTTTTVNSTTVTVEDPIITLGSGAPTTDDNKDRGIAFNWYDGVAKTGFIGFDDSAGKFTFIPEAKIENEVVTSGTAGILVADLEGNADTATDADQLDGQHGSYYRNWGSLTGLPSPTIEVALTGDVSGVAQVTEALGDNISLSINTTILNNSIELGTDTTGDYVESIDVSGTGLSIDETSGEGSTPIITSNATPVSTTGTLVARDTDTGGFSAGDVVLTKLNVDNIQIDGNTISATNTNGNIIITPNASGALQADSDGDARGTNAVDWQMVRATGTKVASGSYSVIAGGSNNIANGEYSIVSGGSYHCATGANSTVGGGFGNCATAFSSNVAGGRINSASADSSTVSGGYRNCATARCSTIGGGSHNCATNTDSTVGGGVENCAAGSMAIVGGGARNCAIGLTSIVSGGFCNRATNTDSTVGGGRYNCACGINSTVSGGYCNSATNINSTVSGGKSNCASGCASTIAGGRNNTLSGIYSFAVGKTNDDAGYEFVNLLGSGLTATQGHTTYVENLIATGVVTADQFVGDLTGNADTATTAVDASGLTSAVTIQVSDQVSGSGTFQDAGDTANIAVSLTDASITGQTPFSGTVDGANDYLLMYDGSDGLRKISAQEFVGDLDIVTSFEVTDGTTTVQINQDEALTFSDGTGAEFVVTDVGGQPTVTVNSVDSEIVHDNLSGFVANEHINHSSVTFTAGSGISGGGDLTTNRRFDIDISEYSTTAVGAGDSFLMLDNDGSTEQRSTVDQLGTYMAGTNITNTAGVLSVPDSTIDGVVFETANFVDSDTVDFTVTAGTSVTAIVKDLSITEGKRSRSVDANVTGSKTADKDITLVNASTGNVTISLPENATSGRVITIKRKDGSTNNVVISRSGADSIDTDFTTVQLYHKNETMTFVSDGSNWWSI